MAESRRAAGAQIFRSRTLPAGGQRLAPAEGPGVETQTAAWQAAAGLKKRSNHRGRRRLLLAAAAAIALGLAGEPLYAAGAIDAFEHFLADTPRASGKFRQEIIDHEGGRDLERSAGRFAFERPGRFRWEVLEPYEQLMVADGSQLWFYDRDLEQVTVRPLAEAMGATPAAMLFGSRELDKTFSLADAGVADGIAWLVATPLTRDAGFEQLRVGFADGLPRTMEVLDAFGRTVRFHFEAIDTHPELPADTFRFEVPPGVDLITQ